MELSKFGAHTQQFFADCLNSLELVQAFNGIIQVWRPHSSILADCLDSLKLVQAFNEIIQVWSPYILINSCRLFSDSISPYSAVLPDCFQIAYKIGEILLHHCNWEANYMAHNLDRHVFALNSYIFWDDDPLVLLFRMLQMIDHSVQFMFICSSVNLCSSFLRAYMVSTCMLLFQAT